MATIAESTLKVWSEEVSISLQSFGFSAHMIRSILYIFAAAHSELLEATDVIDDQVH